MAMPPVRLGDPEIQINGYRCRAALLHCQTTAARAARQTLMMVPPGNVLTQRGQGLWPRRKDPPDKWPLTVLIRLARRARWLPAQVQGEGLADVDTITDDEVDELMGFVSDVRNMAAHPGGYARDELASQKRDP
jgi:hypothetical protein